MEYSNGKKNEADASYYELRRQLYLMETLKTISSRFVGIKPFNEAIDECLEDIRALTGASSAYLYVLGENYSIMSKTHELCAEGVSPQKKELQRLPAAMLPWSTAKLQRGEVIFINDVDQMPDEAEAERKLLKRKGIKSVLAFPIFIGDVLKGFIGFENVRNTSCWTSDDLEHLKVASELISGAMARDKAEEKLHFVASHDFLTSVPNRYSLEKVLQTISIKATGEKTSALLIVDIDNFKVINDTFGHTEGDRILLEVVKRLKRYIRQGDFLARIGGDEFAIILQNINVKQARILAQRLLIKLGEEKLTIGPDKIGLSISISIGIAEIDGTLSSEKVLSNADVALYSAKEEGKNRIFVVKDSDQRTRISSANEIIMLINEGLKNNRFILHYQPIYSNNGNIDHYEALIRLSGPDGEIIYPQTFLPIAERFGLVSTIDRWVVEQVIDVLEKCPNRSIFVNISANSLANDELLHNIVNNVLKSKIKPTKIGFEITESTTIKDLPRARYWVRKLKDLGCSIALDDFGAGFSSFTHLNQLPIDYVKIDGSFVKNLDSDPTSLALVKAMNAVAHTLGKATVAEFVENEKIWEIIKELDIDYGQGYYLGKPEPYSN